MKFTGPSTIRKTVIRGITIEVKINRENIEISHGEDSDYDGVVIPKKLWSKIDKYVRSKIK